MRGITTANFVVWGYVAGALTSVSAGGAARSAVAIIPEPVTVDVAGGEFLFTPETQVVATGDATREAQKLTEVLAPAMGYRCKLTEAESESERGRHVVLSLDRSIEPRYGREGYTLRVTSNRVDLRAREPAGLFYGAQTLRQLLPPQVFSPRTVDGVAWSVPCVTVVDYPRFRWRGLLIDPARHFIPKRDVYRMIDLMALHKFNRLQVHLTDDHGWRIEIRKYPKLTEIGAKMDFTTMRQAEGEREAGAFYSQSDIREIVRYAHEHHITIVPEIEMPAHTGAAIVAYPRLGLDTVQIEKLPPAQRWRTIQRILAPRPGTVTFMQDVLTEVMDLFPGPYIHIGGDEANTAYWEKSEEMQDQMRRMNLKDVHALHSWFIRQMDAFLTSHGRRLVGWDEILQGGLAPGATVMSWRGMQGGISAARAGHDVIMAPTSHTYFDYLQGPRESEPVAIGGNLPLETVYRLEPIPETLTPEQAKHILGGQGQLWGEYITNQQHREYMAFPRACALSEVLWSTPRGRNENDFFLRLGHHLERLRAAGVAYRPLDKEPGTQAGPLDAQAPDAVRGLLTRLLPDHTDQFDLEVIPPAAGRDVFEIESRNGRIVIRGNTGVAMAMGIHWYLKHFCRCHVTWFGDPLRLPDPLPQVTPKVRRTSWAKHRYFLNYCCFGYSLPWYDWPQWERLIDWMALNGINAPLSVTGQEAVWQAVCRRLGMDEQAIADFLAGPPYLPFQWMGCLDGWGGPIGQRWIDRHEQLGKKILARQRELGMRPILQGFTGHVPAAMAQKHPQAKLYTIHWIEWQTRLLDPLDPQFAKMAQWFMEEQASRFGTDHCYAADTFIEMTPPSGDLADLADLSQAIYNGMARSDPQAVWVLQGWTFFNQRQFWTSPRVNAFLDAIPNDRMLVLDLFCESTPMWNRTEAFRGKPWLWCNVQNFGGTIQLGGAMNRIGHDPLAARSDPQGGNLAGLGFVNEGLGYNPAVYDLMYEMAWRDQPVDLDAWVSHYADHRYGQPHGNARRAWQLLARTVYQAPCRTSSVIEHTPTLSPGIGFPPYDNADLAEVWHLLLEASADLGDGDTYRFDVVNVARQVLANHAAVLHDELVRAHGSGDVERFERCARRLLQLMQELDGLLATRREFLLGRWLENAKRWGATDEERRKLQWNARRVLTLWGETPAIDDYARKDWSGMLEGYYRKRWAWFLREVGDALRRDQPFDGKAFDAQLRQWMMQWSDQQDVFPVEPRGDSVSVARKLWRKYAKDFQPTPR